jgi:hypothetical protein
MTTKDEPDVVALIIEALGLAQAGDLAARSITSQEVGIAAAQELFAPDPDAEAIDAARLYDHLKRSK